MILTEDDNLRLITRRELIESLNIGLFNITHKILKDLEKEKGFPVYKIKMGKNKFENKYILKEVLNFLYGVK